MSYNLLTTGNSYHFTSLVINSGIGLVFAYIFGKLCHNIYIEKIVFNDKLDKFVCYSNYISLLLINIFWFID